MTLDEIPAALAAEARAYLDDLIGRRSARLRVYEVDDDIDSPLWVAHVEWNDGDPVAPIVGYTSAGRSQGEAIYSLMQTVQDDRENVR